MVLPKQKHFRKQIHSAVGEKGASTQDEDEDEDEERRLTLEDIKFQQKQRERRAGLAAAQLTPPASGVVKSQDKGDGEGKKEELVLQDTFAQETAVTVEDPNMLNYVEQELAKKHGRDLGIKDEESKPIEDDLYIIPEHLKVRKRNSEESSTQWTTGIAEVQLPIEFKLRNIEETEAAKKQLQGKRPFVGRGRLQSSIPASYSADFFQRGREYAEKFRRGDTQPVSYKEREHVPESSSHVQPEKITGEGSVGNRRQAATDEIMLERFRKRERSRLMRR